jgi:hypothetical protein
MNGQIVFKDRFDAKGYTDENSLATALLTKPDTINAVVTHLGGKESEKYPLTFLTEGQVGGASYKEIQDAQYMWDVQRRDKKWDEVVSTTYVLGNTPGINNTRFFITFKSRWLVEQHPIVSKNGVKARIMNAPIQIGSHFQYELQLTSGSPTAFCPLSELTAGSKWAMVGNGLVSESDSVGNRSNIQTPGKMKNQLSFMRKSYRYSGNVANTMVEVSFITEGGKQTMKWMDFEEFKHQMMWRENVEEHCWESEYNRNENGVIMLKDDVTSKPIPIGAGVFQQIPNSDTYGELTYNKLNNIIGDVAYGATDTEKMQIVMYAGKGFLRDFDEAIKNRALGLTQVSDAKFIKGEGRNLMLTGFFKQFEHVDGHTVIVKWLPLLDFGGRAQASEKHPITGFPLTSHEAIFLDQSSYDGERNIKMITQKGRSMIRGVIKGMAPLNGGSGGGVAFAGNNFMATEQDNNSVHFFSAKSINISRNEHCFRLKCNLS